MNVVIIEHGEVQPWDSALLVEGRCDLCGCLFRSVVGDCKRIVWKTTLTDKVRQSYQCKCPECENLTHMEKAQ